MMGFDLKSAVIHAFNFLVKTYRYAIVEIRPERVQFQGNGVCVYIRFDAARSYELGVEVSLIDGERFSLGELLRMANTDEAKPLSSIQATDQQILERTTIQMAKALKVHGAALLQGDSNAFEALARFSHREADEYQHKSDLAFAIADARAAWSKKDYASVVAFLEPYTAELSRSDLKRLQLSQSRKK